MSAKELVGALAMLSADATSADGKPCPSPPWPRIPTPHTDGKLCCLRAPHTLAWGPPRPRRPPISTAQRPAHSGGPSPWHTRAKLRGPGGGTLLLMLWCAPRPPSGCAGTAVDLTRKLRFVYRMLDGDGKGGISSSEIRLFMKGFLVVTAP